MAAPIRQVARRAVTGARGARLSWRSGMSGETESSWGRSPPHTRWTEANAFGRREKNCGWRRGGSRSSGLLTWLAEYAGMRHEKQRGRCAGRRARFLDELRADCPHFGPLTGGWRSSKRQNRERPRHTLPRYRCSLSGLAGFTFPGRRGHTDHICRCGRLSRNEQDNALVRRSGRGVEPLSARPLAIAFVGSEIFPDLQWMSAPGQSASKFPA